MAGRALQCNLCNDDAPNEAMQQILAVFKKFGIRNHSSGKPNSNNAQPARVPRCLDCGQPDHTDADSPKPEVPKDERPCFECGKQGHLARDCPSKPQASSSKRPPARNTTNNRRPPARANNIEKALNQISFFIEKTPAPAHTTSSSISNGSSHFERSTESSSGLGSFPTREPSGRVLIGSRREETPSSSNSKITDSDHHLERANSF